MTKNYYVNGNTVRELESPVRRDGRTKEELEEIKRRKRRRNAARRNRQRAMEMSRGYVFFLSGCVCVVAVMAVLFVNMQSNLTSRMKNIANLEGQVTDLRADNDARYKNAVTSVDLNDVKDIAVNKLGMSYPKKNQIKYYTVDNNNFMDQYRDIPEE